LLAPERVTPVKLFQFQHDSYLVPNEKFCVFRYNNSQLLI